MPQWKPPAVRHGLHLGSFVKSFINSSPILTQKDVAKKLGMSYTGWMNKQRSPIFGDTYDIIDVCLALDHDMIAPLLDIVEQKGVYTTRKIFQKKNEELIAENEELKLQIINLRRETELLYKTIEKYENLEGKSDQ